MEHATLETWHVACRRNPALPAPRAGVTVQKVSANEPAFVAAAAAVGFTPACVISVSARLISGEALRQFVSALARATDGVVLTDAPLSRAEPTAAPRAPSLTGSWTALVAEAEAGASTLEAEKRAWQPDPADDWADLV